jgi:hypothetical protein
VNSTDPFAIQTDSGSSITASSFQFAGQGYNLASLNPPVVTRLESPVSDPLSLTPPTLTGMNFLNGNVTGSGNVVLSPGEYNGISVNLNPGGTVTLQPGIYLINGGGLNINSGSITGTGVMIYNGADSSHTAGPINISPDSIVNLSPPTSGTYAGVTLFQSSKVTNTVTIQGNHNKRITGAIYAPQAKVDLLTNTPPGTIDILGGPVICWTSHVQGQFQMNAASGGSLYGLVD